MDNFQKAKKILIKYKQEHLLAFYDELDNKEKEFLVNQILRINFQQIFNLYEASKTDEVIPTNSIEPLPYIDKSKLSEKDIFYYTNIGENCIKNNQFAVVTMAGGQRNKAWI